MRDVESAGPSSLDLCSPRRPSEGQQEGKGGGAVAGRLINARRGAKLDIHTANNH